jgi:AraC-like DNA-binding protein
VDAIAGLLDGPRARGAFLLRLAFEPPWAVRIQDEAPIAVISVVRGTSLVIADGEEPVRLQAGDVAIARGPRPYVIADDPASAIQAIVHPGQDCRTPDGRELKLEWSLGTRTWGNAADGETVLMTGVYESAGEISSRLLRALPPLLVQRLDSPLIALLADEIVKDEQGQEAVLDRLLDLILIAVLRAYFARPEAPGWYRAYADPVVGPAIRMLHAEPAHPRTIQELAHRIGVSRAALARRFNDLVGEPPMSFLTGWRIALAADLLLEPGATVGSVAPQVGYGSSFALSTAFKRLRGISPQQYRSVTAT